MEKFESSGVKRRGTEPRKDGFVQTEKLVEVERNWLGITRPGLGQFLSHLILSLFKIIRKLSMFYF
mgnify:FL=1